MKKGKIVKLGDYDKFISWEIKSEFGHRELSVMMVRNTDVIDFYFPAGSKKNLDKSRKELAKYIDAFAEMWDELAKLEPHED